MRINYTVELLTPGMTASLGVIGKDIDATVKRDKDNRPYFNAKHIKGIVRERIRQFKLGLGESAEATEKFIEKYFGKEGQKPQLRFSNLVLKNEASIKDRHGIKVDRRTRTAQDTSLFNYEFVTRGAKFTSEIEVDNSISEEDLRFIVAALFHLEYIGGLKSRGLGKVEVEVNNYKIKDLDKAIKEITNIKPKKEKAKKELNYKRYSYELVFEEPFILTKQEIGNYVEVRDSIQGATIRGAVINYLNNSTEVGLESLLKIEASNADLGKVKLASQFVTKYPIKGAKVAKDKVIYTDTKVDGIKLERGSLGDFAATGNEMSVKIDEKTKSAAEGMLFNTEFIECKEKFTGDIYLPSELINEGTNYTIYIGKLKYKGYGKAKIVFKKYNEKSKDLEKRIEKLNSQIGENKYITFDLCSDLVLPFNEIYDVDAQFRALANLGEGLTLDPSRSFINTGKLGGYNIINNVRKMDELILVKGSVLTYKVEKELDIEALKKIEESGLGLRRNEGFGRVLVCSTRGDK